MSFIEIIAYAGALLIGIVLGLIGGGGSILTVPILVYALAINPVIATAYSLFVVGISSLIGAIKNLKSGRIDFKTAIIFAVPAFTAVYLTRAFLIPAIPSVIFSSSHFVLTKNLFIMLFFAVIMLFTSVRMINYKTVDNDQSRHKPSYILLVFYGVLIGLITGTVGAGGGFLIVPALVLLAKLPMKKAVATSLLIIAINSLIGFMGDVQHTTIDWHFLLPFTGISVLGIFIGIGLTKYIEGKKLKSAFGWFVLIMGVYILYKELAM